MNSLLPKEEGIPLEVVHEISVRELAEFRKFKSRQSKISNSEIVRVVEEGNDLQTINLIQRQLAFTVAHLDQEIQERSAQGKSCTSENMRKIRALNSLGSLIFSKRQIALNEAINLKSDSFSKVFTEMLELVRSSASEAGVPQYHVDALFNRLSQNLVGWEDRVQKKIAPPENAK